jgi:hypothetical protein
MPGIAASQAVPFFIKEPLFSGVLPLKFVVLHDARKG